MNADRSDATRNEQADALLGELQRQDGGRLTIFLGAAPGVGKTYAMLSRARELRRQGIDVVVGLVETHGRVETQALLDGLEVLPRKRIEYQDRRLEELDLDALLGEQPLPFLEYRQGLEAEEVELHQPRGLDIFHVELRDRHVRARVAIERDQLVERAVADDDAGSVGGSVARQALELHRQVEQPPDVGIAVILRPELGDAV